jgi:hypothetical protein
MAIGGSPFVERSGTGELAELLGVEVTGIDDGVDAEGIWGPHGDREPH